MFGHPVIVKFKLEVTEEVKKEAIKDVLALKETIPQITVASAGKNFTDRGKGYEYGNVLSWLAYVYCVLMLRN